MRVVFWIVPDGRSQVWKYRRRPEKKILSPRGERNEEVWIGVCFTWTEVSSGCGCGWAFGAMWWR